MFDVKKCNSLYFWNVYHTNGMFVVKGDGLRFSRLHEGDAGAVKASWSTNYD